MTAGNIVVTLVEMSAPPRTVLAGSPDEAFAIRGAVRAADLATLQIPGLEIASREHVTDIVELLRDTAVSDPIYDLPRPFTIPVVAGWVAESNAQRMRGEALLLVIRSSEARMIGYSMLSVWPDLGSAELAGGLRAEAQSAGIATLMFPTAVAWMFTTLGIRLICMTAALDNVRSARLIDRAGFVRAGERDAIRPDGTVRRSRYWELTREQWVAQHAPEAPCGGGPPARGPLC